MKHLERYLCFGLLCLLFIYIGEGTEDIIRKKEPELYCTFFGNRGPKPQSNLKNCTWFQTNTCCMQEEIDATFGRVKPLIGASLACQRYTNYLMCYICAPNQNCFYKKERLTVCEEFCKAWFEACGSAILKGSVISSLYKDGKAFCKGRSFDVDMSANDRCYNFDPAMDKANFGTRCSTSFGAKNIISFVLFVYMLKSI